MKWSSQNVRALYIHLQIYVLDVLDVVSVYNFVVVAFYCFVCSFICFRWKEKKRLFSTSFCIHQVYNSALTAMRMVLVYMYIFELVYLHMKLLFHSIFVISIELLIIPFMKVKWFVVARFYTFFFFFRCSFFQFARFFHSYCN